MIFPMSRDISTSYGTMWEYTRDMGKIKIPHRKINLSSLIIVGFQNFWVFSKVESTWVSLAHKPLGKNENRFKKFRIQNENLSYFHENPSRAMLEIQNLNMKNLRFHISVIWNLL